MRLLATTLVLAASSAAAAAAAAAAAVVDSRLNSRATNETSTTSYLAQMADTWLRRGVEKDFDYATAVLYKGLELAIEAAQQPEGANETLAAFYEDQMSIVAEDGTIAGYNYSFYSLDDYRFGMSALYWHRRTGGAERARWRRAADRIRAMLDAHPRTASGGFWHRAPQYPDQMWLDGIFMADSFYARHTAAFAPGNASAWDDVVLQYDLVEAHCGHSPTDATSPSGLLKHGYDESGVAVWADPVTGASPLVWDRADGWFFVSLLETLEVFPRAHAGHARLVGYFESLAEGLLRAQDPASGGWWLVMDAQYAGAEGNYIESSATAMFTYGFLKGIKLGLLDEATYLAPAKKAYEMMVDRFVVKQDNGTLDWEGTVIVGSLSGNASYQYYISQVIDENDYKGIGPFMWASYEYEAL